METAEAPAGADARPADPREMLADVRARVARGEPLVGQLAATFHRAVHAIDPGPTEDTLARLPGNGGVHLYDSLLAWAPLIAGETVLDVGCGSGGAARAAARIVGREGRVTGIDPSPEAIAMARERTPPELPVRFALGVAENLRGVADKSVDCVVASLVLEHVTSLDRAVGEFARVLRPGGKLVASVMAFDRLRPMDSGLMGAVVAVVGRHAPGALAGRASRASIPHEPPDQAAFKAAGFSTVEERDVQLAAVMETEEDAWAIFSRTYIAHLLDEAGIADLRKALRRRLPHTLYLPVRFMRTRRPG